MSEDNIKERESKQLIFFNEAVEYFDKFNEKELLVNQEINNSAAPIFTHINHLRDEMLNELNYLRDLIINNPDRKLELLSEEEKNDFHEFIKFYSICPVCGSFNHYFNLKKLYFDENEQLKEDLIKFMSLKNEQITFGICCCNCFKKWFEEE